MRKVFLLLLLICLSLVLGCSWPSDLRGQTKTGATENKSTASEMLELALSYKAIYLDMDKGSAFNAIISQENIAEIVKLLAADGYTVTAYMQDMKNHQQFETFLLGAMNGQEDSSYYYRVNADGGLTRYDYQSKDNRLYLTTQTLIWDEEDAPYIQSQGDPFMIEEWEYTNKGFLVYEANRSPLCHTLLRVIPLGEEKRELCEKYIAPIGYSGNNLFLVDWTPSNWSGISFNDVYDVLLYLETGSWPEYDLSIEQISANELEPLCMKYFGVSKAYLRENAIYYEDDNAYFWNYPTCGKHDILFPSPVPEVIDIRENEDGTLTMVVDVLDIYQGNDRVFTHEVTIRIHEDSSFEYVSNHVYPDDWGNVPSYTPRSTQVDLFPHLNMP